MRFLLDHNVDLGGFMYFMYDEQLDNLFTVHYPDIDYVIESTGEVLDYLNKPYLWKFELRFDYEQMFNLSGFNKYDFYDGIRCLIESGEIWLIPETCFEYDQFERIALIEFANENLIDQIISIHPDKERD